MPFLPLTSTPEPALNTTPAAGTPKGVVLVTGGSGFIASHIIDYLLADGFEVVATARSKTKGRQIVEGVRPEHAQRVHYAVVEDISKPGAFDTVLQSTPFDYVIHTASPYHNNVVDPVKDFLDPAIKGTTGILHSIQRHASTTVRRVVLTSSSAAILNPGHHAPVYDETCWAPATWELAMDPRHTYRCSKVFSEQAAWAFVSDNKNDDSGSSSSRHHHQQTSGEENNDSDNKDAQKSSVSFDLAVINGTYTFGPIQRCLPSLEAMNTSNHRIRDMVLGRMRDALEPTAPVFTWVDVRDVALAHVRAMTMPEAGGNRFYVVGGHFSNKKIADVIQKHFPQLEGKLPPVDSVDDLPDDVYRFDNTKSKEVLGLKYRTLEESVVDTVHSILEHGIAVGEHVR